jgi:hypothetical protein
VTPELSEALAAFLVAEHDADATLASLTSIGAVSGHLSANEDDETVIASAICRGRWERWVAGRACWRWTISYAEEQVTSYAETRRIIGGLQISKRDARYLKWGRSWGDARLVISAMPIWLANHAWGVAAASTFTLRHRSRHWQGSCRCA